MAQEEQALSLVAEQGRATVSRGTGQPARHPDDVRLAQIMRTYDQLGAEPPEFNVAANDDAYRSRGAHTIDRHGYDMPLRRDPAEKTIEGRIYGDDGWDRPDNWSLRWTDPTTMNREINDYVRQNWEEIRTNLAVDGSHSGAFNAGHRVGEGFYNDGMFGVGPRNAHYTAASLVRVSIDLVPGSDPPQPFIVTAFPAGVVPFGLL
ncbi:hypothetical protein [Paractinoplanes rishiriensis]|uniref:hypothetical protein n=1 Tax=Paractinoplanes rishiriensis TaxID=1050105 RepID=UPI00194564FB|nr:hypothetical protein [Actinoplanes rishiriensis]